MNPRGAHIHTHTPWRTALVATAALAALSLVSSAARAQDASPAEGEEPTGDPPVTDTEKLGSGSVERDLDLYWGGKRDVSPVENKLFSTGGRAEFTLFSGVIPNDPFFTYIPVGGRFNYHFTDGFGVELSGAWHGEALQLPSELTTFLEDARQVESTTDLRDTQQWRANGVLVWSPFYGKLALLQRKLSHFDLYLVAGGGVVSTTGPNPERDGTLDEIKPEGIFGAGWRFFLTPSFSVRLDWRQGIFAGTGEEGGIQSPAEFTLGLSFMTGG